MSKKYDDAVAAEAQWEAWQFYRWAGQRNDRETFAIDSPPPTVSGPVFGYTHQDLIARHKRMTGKKVRYRMGWSHDGLPTERRVRNYYHVVCDPSLPYDRGIRVEVAGEGEPLRSGRANFIALCQRMTNEDEKLFKHLFTRPGPSIDGSFEYASSNEYCRRLNQRSFIRLFEAGEVYSAEGPSIWDADFQTAVAQAEIGEREISCRFHKPVFEAGIPAAGLHWPNWNRSNYQLIMWPSRKPAFCFGRAARRRP